MSKKQNNLKDELAQEAGKTSLNENELESVSGGVDISDIRCGHCWVPHICNGCPHLRKMPGEEEGMGDTISYRIYWLSCGRSYFGYEKYKEHISGSGL